jgi:DNA polymerase III subunit epsilon
VGTLRFAHPTKSMFAPKVAFLDLETTGGSASRDRVTEIGVIVVRDDAGERQTWETLVNPEQRIPPDIQRLTGITNEMVATAPRFADVAQDLLTVLDGAVLVAHNARFDYSFLKAEFARLGITFSMPLVCTVRLSRALFPDQESHRLDALIERHNIHIEQRHRAMGDTQAIAAFVDSAYRKLPRGVVNAAVAMVLRRASMPPHLPQGVLASLPQAPGVYLFIGESDLVLYVGKAKNIRDRVGQHFTNDFASDKELELSQAVRDVRFEITAGEFSAHLREIELIHELKPTHNAALKKKALPVTIVWDEKRDRPRIVALEKLPASAQLSGFGLFTSQGKARDAMLWLVRSEKLCAVTLGLERQRKRLKREDGTMDPRLPCFAFQLGRCAGACLQSEDHESVDTHRTRTLEVLEGLKLAPWPSEDDGGALCVEEQATSSAPSSIPRAHWFNQWRYLGSTESSSSRPSQELDQIEFNLDIYRLIVRTIDKRPAGLEFVWVSEERG